MSGEPPKPGDGQQPRQSVNFAQFVRPEQIKHLPHFDDAQKVKYEDALRKMWTALEQSKGNTASPEFRQAVQSLSNASQRIRAHIKTMNQQQAQNMQLPPGQQGNVGPMGGQAQQMPVAGGAQQQQQQRPAQGQQQAPMQLASFPPMVQQRINAIEWATPAGSVAGTPDAEGKLLQIKVQYGQAVLREAQVKDAMQKMQPVLQNYARNGGDIPQEMQKKFVAAKSQLQQAQEMQKRIQNDQDTLRAQQGSMPQAASPSINASMQAAAGNAQGRPTQSPATAQGQQPPTPQQPAGVQNMQRPGPFNLQQQPMQTNSPQTQGPPGANVNAGSATSLSHQGALAASNAARAQYTGAQGSNPPSASGIPPAQPQSSAGQNPPSYPGGPLQRSESGLNANPKMPIPKQLNVTQPTPVTMGPQRPTLGGIGSGPGVQGVMGQPAMQKPPGYTLEGEGEHVLSKKKLDELVRQVTGAEGPSTGLSQECEEAMLSIADEFIDDVITAACRLAKLRDSATLDIRDIQIILERNYNIRIPGYALDEVRTVRKFHPAPGWTQKMNSIQAAKVMGGKNDV